MKGFNLLFVISLLFLTFSLSLPQKAHATVGGQTIIYDFKYNPANESVYYTELDFGGRGCPPVLKNISLNSEKVTTAFSCDQGETMPGDKVTAEISKISNGFKPLTSLSLKQNNISFDVTFTSAENYSPEVFEIVKRNFIVSVYQNGKKVDEFPITGCNLDQPFTFQGYAIPGFNKKIIVLTSAKSNCFEGGYTAETLQVIGGVDNLQKEETTTFYKGQTALLPNEGNVVVYEKDKVVTSTSTQVTTSTSTTVDPTPVEKENWFVRFITWLKNLFN